MVCTDEFRGVVDLRLICLSVCQVGLFSVLSARPMFRFDAGRLHHASNSGFESCRLRSNRSWGWGQRSDWQYPRPEHGTPCPLRSGSGMFSPWVAPHASRIRFAISNPSSRVRPSHAMFDGRLRRRLKDNGSYGQFSGSTAQRVRARERLRKQSTVRVRSRRRARIRPRELPPCMPSVTGHRFD
jgi:hypothetical protein